jgi:hypothetical protein
MFEAPNMNTPLWVGAEIVCKEPLTTGDLNIPVGTRGSIHSFVGNEVNIEFARKDPFEIPQYMHQLRLDFLYYWKVTSEEPSGESVKVPMIVFRHPDGGPPKGGLKYLGYWAGNEDPLKDYYAQREIILPWPGHYVDLEWDSRERALVVEYLKSCPDVEHWMGYSCCRLCGTCLGASDKGDGIYVWPAGFDHYVEAHGVRPPDEFVKRVKR